MQIATEDSQVNHSIMVRHPEASVDKHCLQQEESGGRLLLDHVIVLNEIGVARYEAQALTDALHCFSRALSQLWSTKELVGQCPSPTKQLSGHFNMPPSLSLPSAGRDHGCITFTKCEYDEGMGVFSTPLRIARSGQEDTAPYLAAASMMFNIGLVLKQQGFKDDALRWHLDAFVAMESTPRAGKGTRMCPNFHAIMVPLLHNIGGMQYRNGDLQQALYTYEEALRTCCDQQDFLYEAVTLNCLGVVHFQMPEAQTTNAMEYLVRAKFLQEKALGPGHPLVATTVNNIGRVHYMEGRFEPALAAYQHALQVRRVVLGNDSLDVAATVYNLGQTLHQSGQREKALTYYQEFLRIAVPKLGYKHRDVGIMLKCMAQLYHERRDYDSALNLYQSALESCRSSLGAHAEVASILNKMGNLFYEQERYETAIEMYQQGLEVERAVLAPYHTNIVVTLTNIGQIEKQRGNYDTALRMYNDALHIQVHSLGNLHPAVATTLSNKGLIYYQMRDFSAALEMYQEALSIRREHFGDDNLEVASSLNSIGMVLFKLGLHQYSLQSFGESLRIRRTILGNEHRDVSVILYNIATIYMELGNEEGAMQCYQETLRIEKEALDPHHTDIILTLQYIAQLQLQRGETDEALACWREVLSIQLHNQADALELAGTYNTMANMYLQQGDGGAVVAAMTQASRLVLQAGGTLKDLRLSGFLFYGFAKKHPLAAAMA